MSSRVKSFSTRAQAERYLRAMATWVTSADLAMHLSIPRRNVTSELSVAVARGTVQKRTEGGVVSWLYVGEPAARSFPIARPPGFKPQFGVRA